ncbi:potassium channel family protein [Thiobacillus thioparus]|uniref:potassium channel family protein n=1 Tax=Thiobacillus thioparus TaxID=931 RepID=UPI0003A3862E|nr:potassium channel family protein [Thiobacillus thioparus]
MFIVALACILLLASTTVTHYEALSSLNTRLVSLAIPNRSKLLVVISTAFMAHALEMTLYGLTLYFLTKYFGVGALSGPSGHSLASCLYFSAETYTSLGFGDLTPVGQIRMIAGVEALNGLLLIGWSASYTYIAMERFWNLDAARRHQ